MNKILPLLIILFIAVSATPVLAAEPGYIAVTTNPAGGQVYIDNKYVMDSPGKAMVQPGEHLVRIQSSEYFPWSDRVEVKEGETTNVDAVMHFYKAPGSIGLTSSMPEVDVYIDDMYYASARSGTITIPNLSPAAHDVRVVKAGYHDFVTTVQVISDKIVGVYSDQTKDTQLSGIRVNSNPGSAVVYLDNNYTGVTPSGSGWLQISGVAPGTHTLRISKDGYEMYETSSLYNAGGAADTSVKLDLIPEAADTPAGQPTGTTVPPAPTKSPVPFASLLVLGAAGIFLRR